MYFKSRIKGKHGLSWFDSRTEWEKSSDEYFEKLDDLAQQLDDVDAELNFYTSLAPEGFDSGYDYVYARIKELNRYIHKNESSDELDPMNRYGVRESLQDIYEELLDLYDSALLYDNYSGPDPDDPDDDDDDLDDDYDDDDSDDDWDDDFDLDDDDDNDSDWGSGNDKYDW